MKVSIIIPVYNVELYLKECLNSAVNQTLKEIEIICVNDGSTDSSLEILNVYEDKYYNLKIINQENRGLSGARNAGIKASKGKYIYFLDSDDYIELDAMRVCYEEAEKYTLDILTFDARTFYDENYDGIIINEDYNRSQYLRQSVISGEDFYILSNQVGGYRAPVWLNFYSKNFIEENKLYFYEGILHEDEIYTIKSLINAKKVKYIPKKFFNRRIRKDSIMTSNIDIKRINSNLIIANETYNLYKYEQLKCKTKVILIEWIRKYYSNSLMFSDMLKIINSRNKIVNDIKHKEENIIDINLDIQINAPSLFYSKLI